MPYATSFDHLRVADEVHFKFERCLKALGPAAIRLQRYGLGHSLGALLHALIGSRYPIASAGNVLMSYNNRPATGARQRGSQRQLAAGRCCWPLLPSCWGVRAGAGGHPSIRPPTHPCTPFHPPTPHRLDPAAVAVHRAQPAGAGPHPVTAGHLAAAVGRGAVGGPAEGCVGAWLGRVLGVHALRWLCPAAGRWQLRLVCQRVHTPAAADEPGSC